MRLSQPHLIRRIVESIPGMKNANPRSTPACNTIILNKDKNGKIRKANWNYRSLIGMLNYLVNSTHSEVAFTVHQCARFCEDLKASHEQAVQHIAKYLLSTQTERSK